LKMFTAGLMTETTSLSPIPTGLADFEREDRGGHLLAAFVARQVDVFDSLAEERGWEVARGLVAGAMPGGLVTRHAHESLRDELLADLRSAMPVDIVLLALHGAMTADGYDDCEGDLLKRVRDVVGPDVPIGVELDPHANLSHLMVESADILVCYKDWPHVDTVERARDVFHLTAAVLEGRVKPTVAVWDCRMMGCYHTMEPPVKGLIDRFRALERRADVLSISLVHGYPFGDVPDAGTKMMVFTDGNPTLAEELAESLGRQLFDMRGRTHPPHVGLNDGLDAVAAADSAPVVVADTSDAPGGGAPGDATYVLEGLLRRGIPRVALAYLWDPAMVGLAMRAGEGARLPMRIGGKMGPTSGAPLDVDAEVIRVLEDLTVPTEEGPVPVGDVAVIRVGEARIVLSSDRPAAMSAAHFEAAGIDPSACRVLVVKSVNNFRAGFEAIAGEFVYISGPGALDTSLRSHPFQRITRPRWPFDEDPFGADGPQEAHGPSKADAP